HAAAAQGVVVQKITLNHISLVAKCDEELLEPVMRVMLHDVPQDRTPPNLDHWLGPHFRFLGQARAKAARQNDHFHGPVPPRGLLIATGRPNLLIVTTR